jgi:hypothetical protein
MMMMMMMRLNLNLKLNLNLNLNSGSGNRLRSRFLQLRLRLRRRRQPSGCLGSSTITPNLSGSWNEPVCVGLQPLNSKEEFAPFPFG